MNISPNSSDPKTAILNQVKQEAAMNNARQLISKINEHCFEKCIPTPGPTLAKREEQCFTMCMEKYLAAWNAASHAYVNRIPRGPGGGVGGGGQGAGTFDEISM